MEKHVALAALALGICAACGGAPAGKPSCSDTSPCEAGSYCAHTPDGNVCWPDTTAPAISAVAVECLSSPCRRDSTVRVTATATDDSGAMGEVKVAFEGDPDHPVALAHQSGEFYEAQVPLADVAFPWFEHALNATVTATDQAGNAAAPGTDVALAGTVTRALWTKTLRGASPVALSAPAILEDGRIALAGSDGKLYLVTKDGQTVSSVQLSDAPSGPPAIGSDGIWLATVDGSLHKRALADAAAIALTDCSTPQPLVGPPAIIGERVVAVSGGVEAIVAKPSNACNQSLLASAASTAAAVDSSGAVLLGLGASLAKYAVTPGSVMSSVWASSSLPAVGKGSEPLSVDGDGAVWTTATSGTVCRTTSAGVAFHASPSASASSSGSIVLADGSAIVGDDSGMLRRYAKTGSPPWPTSAALSGHPAIPLALSGAGPSVLAPTANGWVYAVRASDGTVAWSKKLSGQALQPANIWTEPGARTSTAYLAGADGNLYAIIVDGALDTSAPWPKAFHDPQNTSNAATPL